MRATHVRASAVYTSATEAHSWKSRPKGARSVEVSFVRPDKTESLGDGEGSYRSKNPHVRTAAENRTTLLAPAIMESRFPRSNWAQARSHGEFLSAPRAEPEPIEEEFKQEAQKIIKQASSSPGMHPERQRAITEKKLHRATEQHVKRTKKHGPATLFVNPFPGGVLSGFSERLLTAPKPSCLLGVSKSDVFITEVLKRIPTASQQPSAAHRAMSETAEDPGEHNEEAESENPKPAQPSVCFHATIVSEGTTTPAVIVRLAEELNLPMHAFSVASHTLCSDITVRQTIGIISPAKKAGKVESTLRKLATRQEPLKAASIVDYHPPATSRAIPWDQKIVNSYSEMDEGWVLVQNSAEVPPADVWLTAQSVEGYRSRVLLRDVEDVELLDASLTLCNSVSCHLNLHMLPFASRDGLSAVEAGVAAINGNYSRACSKLLKAVSDTDPEVRQLLHKVATLAALKQKPWYKSHQGENNFSLGTDDLQRLPEDTRIPSERISHEIKELSPGVRWVGQMLYLILCDSGMGRHKRAWLDLPPLIRQAVEDAPAHLLWNRLASERLARLGEVSAPGDLINTSISTIKRVQTIDEAMSVTPTNVVLPVPQLHKGRGWHKGMQFPKNCIGQSAFEVAMRKLGVFPEKLPAGEIAFRARESQLGVPKEAYRKFLSPILAMRWETAPLPVQHNPGEPAETPVSAFDPVIAGDIALSRLRLKNKGSPQAPPPPSLTIEDPPPSHDSSVPSVLPGLTADTIYTHSDWASLLKFPSAPPPPTFYSHAWVCLSCLGVNTDDSPHCEGCLTPKTGVNSQPYHEDRPSRNEHGNLVVLHVVSPPEANLLVLVSEVTRPQ
eukprot:gene10771-16587_t